jgi:hypothetical protein
MLLVLLVVLLLVVLLVLLVLLLLVLLLLLVVLLLVLLVLVVLGVVRVAAMVLLRPEEHLLLLHLPLHGGVMVGLGPTGDPLGPGTPHWRNPRGPVLRSVRIGRLPGGAVQVPAVRPHAGVPLLAHPVPPAGVGGLAIDVPAVITHGAGAPPLAVLKTAPLIPALLPKRAQPVLGGVGELPVRRVRPHAGGEVTVGPGTARAPSLGLGGVPPSRMLKVARRVEALVSKLNFENFFFNFFLFCEAIIFFIKKVEEIFIELIK